jgi:hypothetical protein
MGQTLESHSHSILVHAVLVEVEGNDILLLYRLFIDRSSFIDVSIGGSIG